jgi:hypothetical protein
MGLALHRSSRAAAVVGVRITRVCFATPRIVLNPASLVIEAWPKPSRMIRRPWQDNGMTSSAKRKVSITLDTDLVAAMEGDGSSTTLSAEVNSALRTEFTRRKPG